MGSFNPASLLNAAVYAILGIALFAVAFIVLDKATPQDLWREIAEEKNVALAVLVGFMSLGIAIIIAAAVH
jgi:uncharacterized membrane protein YjfL (UPF0719 family)